MNSSSVLLIIAVIHCQSLLPTGTMTGLVTCRSDPVSIWLNSLPVLLSVGEVMAPYPSGKGFALTADVAAWLLLASDMLLLGGPEDGIVGTWFAGTQIQVHHVPNGFRDLHWKCRQGEDILVHCLRDETAWSMIDAEGNLPCDSKAA